MGTWGTWPTQNDSAMDFLDRLRNEAAEERVHVIREMFRAVLEDSAALGRSFQPEEVIVAAAVIAASLPAGNNLPWNEEESMPLSVVPADSASELKEEAIRAVDIALSYGNGWWYDSWTSPDDRSNAEEALDAMRAALRSSS